MFRRRKGHEEYKGLADSLGLKSLLDIQLRGDKIYHSYQDKFPQSACYSFIFLKALAQITILTILRGQSFVKMAKIREN